MITTLKNVHDRTEYLRKASLKDPDADFSWTVRATHSDRSTFSYDSCHMEFMDTDSGLCVIIVPEHHPARWYPVEDLEKLERSQSWLDYIGPVEVWGETGTTFEIEDRKLVNRRQFSRFTTLKLRPIDWFQRLRHGLHKNCDDC